MGFEGVRKKLASGNGTVLTSHEQGWHDENQSQTVYPVADSEDHSDIEDIIGRVKNRANKEKNAKRLQLENRRNSALRKIAMAAKQVLNLDGEGRIILHKRLERASSARISEAEAMATLAQSCGDFESPLFWWDIKSGTRTIWKGYVLGRWVGSGSSAYIVGKREARIKLDETIDGLTMYMDIVVRKTAKGGFVAEVVGGAGNAAGQAAPDVDVSDGDLLRHAVRAAYVVYHKVCLKVPFEINQVPEGIFESLDFDDSEEYNQ